VCGGGDSRGWETLLPAQIKTMSDGRMLTTLDYIMAKSLGPSVQGLSKMKFSSGDWIFLQSRIYTTKLAAYHLTKSYDLIRGALKLIL
jgi:hypothetical protein